MQPLLLSALLAFPAAEPPPAPPPRPAGLGLPAGADPALADWTPRPALGRFEPWERMTDKDWIDGRFREMNTGPVFNCTMRYPLGKGQETVYKAAVVRLGARGEGGAVFDRCTMRLAAAWAGGYLTHSDRRFGLLNTPTPKGELLFATPKGAGWADFDGGWAVTAERATKPLPSGWMRYRGLSLNGDRAVFRYTVGGAEVFDCVGCEAGDGYPVFTRTVEAHATEKELTGLLLRVGGAVGGASSPDKRRTCHWTEAATDGKRLAFAFIPGGKNTWSQAQGGQYRVTFKPSDGPGRMKLVAALIPEDGVNAFAKFVDATPEPDDLSKLARGGPKRWGEPIVTKLERGAGDGPFAVDTLTIPYKNRFGALFFCTGLDFLPDGRIAVCTCHGDVWLVTADETAGTCSWRRYATGLYHPLGLKVVDGKVVVLERGQLTRLHDLNGDGEADFYECVSNDWHTGGGEHSYDTCLETDPRGDFYFFKTGDTDTPTGGCLMKVSGNGAKAEVYCTGFRHPIGLGVSPSGVITGADQEGNWMPATRIDEYTKGGFYGDMRAHHRAAPPTTFDPPLCWLPREVDNSAGGQVWVPPSATDWGALAGRPLHLSYGRCKAFVLLRQELPAGGAPSAPRVQGGAAALGVEFLSGVCRGRFGPDGHLYACGLNGWQTAAKADGCLQRVRATGRPLAVPVALAVKGDTIRLTFGAALDAKAVAAAENYRAACWNYRWSGDYGSKRWKPSDPAVEGQDEVAVRGATLLADGRTVEVTFAALKPVMQMMVGYNAKTAAGKPAVGAVYLTIHSTGK
jgi:hypothetical protein